MVTVAVMFLNVSSHLRLCVVYSAADLLAFAGEALPSWLPTMLRQHLTQERHHKVLRRLLHLLSALRTTPTAANVTDHIKSSQGPRPARSNPVVDAAVHAEPAVPAGPAVHAEHAVQKYEQVHRMLMQARHPSVRRESLRCLGPALQPLISILTHTANVQEPPFSHPAPEHQPVGQNASQAQFPVEEQSQVQSTSTAWEFPAQQVRGDGHDPAELMSGLLSPAPSQHQGNTQHADMVSNEALRDADSNAEMHPLSWCDKVLPPRQHRQAEDGKQALWTLVDGFVSLIRRSSEAQQFDDIRLAAAASLEASGEHAEECEHVLWVVLGGRVRVWPGPA